MPERAPKTTSRPPKVICLVGSTRFYRAFMRVAYDAELAGEITVGPAFSPEVGPDDHGGEVAITRRQKRAVDAAFANKIAMADEVLVLNVGGYVGRSTLRDIERARALGRPVRWLEPDHAAAASPGAPPSGTASGGPHARVCTSTIGQRLTTARRRAPRKRGRQFISMAPDSDGRLLRHAANLLEEEARCLRECCCTGRKWDPAGKPTRASYDDFMATARSRRGSELRGTHGIRIGDAPTGIKFRQGPVVFRLEPSG
jgi:hypothetical protein